MIIKQKTLYHFFYKAPLPHLCTHPINNGTPLALSLFIDLTCKCGHYIHVGHKVLGNIRTNAEDALLEIIPLRGISVEL